MKCDKARRPVSADGNVPNGNWNSDNAQLKLNRNDSKANSNGGFRVSARADKNWADYFLVRLGDLTDASQPADIRLSSVI